MLYLVATPLGNLQDITLRALETLKQADLILCEDTRKTGLLLQHFQIIGKRLLSYYEHNEQERLPQVMAYLKEQALVALVSNAGTPTISDPGYPLVREALQHGILVEAVPGPSAPITALVASGLPPDKFAFLGFLPKKDKAKLDLLASLRLVPLKMTYVAFDSPERLRDTLQTMQELYGVEVLVSIQRELTKLHEEKITDTLGAVLASWPSDRHIKGEVTLVFRVSP